MQLRYLNKNEHRNWDEFVCTSAQYSIFNSTWLLDAFNKRYEILAAFSKGEMVGGMVLARNAFNLYTNPLFFKHLGIIIKPFSGKECTVRRRNQKVIQALSDAVTGIRTFDYSFSPEFNNWLPFHWNGFNQTIMYTYRIDLGGTIDDIRQDYTKNRKRCVNKAQKEGVHIAGSTPEELYSLIQESFSSKKKVTPFRLQALEKYFKLKSNFFALKAVDSNGRPMAACGILHDESCAYLLFNGSTQGGRAINTYLIHKAIEKCIPLSRFFDFEGSMHRNIEKLYRDMGGRQTPYFRVWRKGVVNSSKILMKSIYNKVNISL